MRFMTRCVIQPVAVPVAVSGTEFLLGPPARQQRATKAGCLGTFSRSREDNYRFPGVTGIDLSTFHRHALESEGIAARSSPKAQDSGTRCELSQSRTSLR